MGPYPRFTISSTLMIVLTIFCISIIFSISYISYVETSNNLINSFYREEKASENLFSKSSIYIHHGLKLWDSTYNERLSRDMQIILTAYNKSGKNPGKINYSEIINQLDPLYRDRVDIYFINSSGVIEYTTDSTEYMMDFSIWPDFMRKITDMLQTDEFIPDEIVKGFLPGSPLRKFVYHSTPDHKYLAQIGLNVQNDSKSERSHLSYGSLVSFVLNESPTLTSLNVINSMGTLVIGKKEYPGGKLDPQTRTVVNTVFSTKEKIVLIDALNQTRTSFIFVPNTVEDTPSSNYMNLVGKFVFSTRELNQQINNTFSLHFFLFVFASLFSILIAALISKRLTNPINQLVHEIDCIAEGDYNQKISEPRHPELKQISDAVRSMVNQITATIWELQESESRYRGLFNTSSDAILIVEGDLIIDANPAAHELFSNNSFSLSGMYINQICPKISNFIKKYQESSENIPPVSELMDSQVTTIREADIKIFEENETTKILNTRVIPLGNNVSSLLQIQIRDITLRVEMEEAMQNMNVYLESQVAERTESLQATIADLDSFTYTVSHDLRSPLRAIDGNAHILEMKCGKEISPELKKCIQKIHENIKKMDNLIDDLLNFSRMSRKPLDSSIIDMNQLVMDVMNELCPSDVNPLIKIRIGFLPQTQGDLALTRQVFINFISNALKFSKPGVLNEIGISAQTEDGKTWYLIQDTGIGFDMQYKERIFEVFLQLNPSGTYEGTGVGLAIVKRIIARHGGRIRVESQEGVGSIFSFTLDSGELNSSKNK